MAATVGLIFLIIAYLPQTYQEPQDRDETFTYTYNEDVAYMVVRPRRKEPQPTSMPPTRTGAAEQEAVHRANMIKEHFWAVFKNRTNFDLANKTFHKLVAPKLKYIHLATDSDVPKSYEESDDDIVIKRVDDQFRQWRDRIQEYLQKKVEALKKLVQTAENIGTNYSSQPPPFDENCQLSYVDIRDSVNESDYLNQTNAIHIPIGVVNCSGVVQRDITWLGNEDLTKTFDENMEIDPSIFRQYISAAESGVTRIYPVAPWKVDPPDMTVDLFDPRSRHWFIRATTCPKDIMFLVDLSGSVQGQTRYLMKLTVMTILTTLTPDDYINAMWYNKDVGLVMSKCFDGFIPATSRNKLLMQRFLDLLGETNEADFEKALNHTYSEFSKWENISRIYSDLQYGAGCHKMIFVLTDTVQETGHELFEKYGFKNETFDVRLFGFAMGFNTPDIEALQYLSCRRSGGYFKVDSLEDIKDESRAYLPILSRPLAMSMHEKAFEERIVSWTGPYMDAQHAGPILTLSMPILNKMKGAEKDKFLGVAAIDVSLSSLVDLADVSLTNGDAYVFATDNNGNMLFHPNLYLPDTDLQMIRRAACFEATPAKRKSEADKVIYWEATEEIKMQMGLMDGMFTIDLAEIETETPQLMQLRDNMISDRCEDEEQIRTINSEKIIHSGRRYAKKVEHSYRCLKLRDTPYTLGLAMKRHMRSPATIVTEEQRLHKINFGNSSVSWIPSPRMFCNGDLAAERLVNRWLRLIEKVYEHNFGCDDGGRTARLLLDYAAVEQWLNNSIWMEEDSNRSCQTAREMYLDVADLTFIQTEGGLTAFYPKCSPSMPRTFSKDVTQSEFFQYARLAPNELSFAWTADGNRVMAYSAIHDHEHSYTMAVIGMQVPVTHVWDWWRYAHNLSSTASCFNNFDQSICYLMTRNYMVLGSSSKLIDVTYKLHLGILEPSLFEHFVNKSTERLTFTDYQERCRPGDEKMPYILSSARSFRLMSLVELVCGVLSGIGGLWSTSFWLNQWTILTSLWSPPIEARLPNCDTAKPRPGEQCTMQYQMYALDLNGTGKEMYFNDDCEADQLYFWTKIENTNLYMIEILLPGDRRTCRRFSRFPIYPMFPHRKTPCEELQESPTLRSRRRYRTDCIAFHQKETRIYDPDHCSSAICRRASMILIGVMLYAIFQIMYLK